MVEKYELMVNTAMNKKKRLDDMVKMKLLLFQSQALAIQSAIENEQVTLDQYMEYLNKGIAHDKVLLQFFEDTGNKKNAEIVRFRIE